MTAFVGGSPTQVPERYALADPSLLAPATCPVWVVRAQDDRVVAAEQSARYVATARAAGGVAEEVVVPGDHFTVIEPSGAAFARLRECLLLGPSGVSK